MTCANSPSPPLRGGERETSVKCIIPNIKSIQVPSLLLFLRSLLRTPGNRHLPPTVFPNTVNSATPGVMPLGQPRITSRAREPTVGVTSR